MLEKHQEILPPTLFIPYLPVCGDRLIQNQEYGIAADCYRYCSRCILSARSDDEMEPPLGAEAVEAEARSQIGLLYCQTRMLQLEDPSGHNHNTVGPMLSMLRGILAQVSYPILLDTASALHHHGWLQAKQLTQGQQYAWVILNASVLVYQVFQHCTSLC